jgi:alanyl-tRNA synthetase
MRSSEIRRKFLEFFKSKGHEVVASDSLVPKGDPSVLFTSAGMNQFKKQFLGKNVTYKRAASSQKCLRTADLDKVGETPSHHTFFEMLGNFSFGDYFKKEAIQWAWEFMTVVLGIKKEKLLVSVYKDDPESYKIWRDLIKVPAKKILKFGGKENFWPSNAPKDGPNGPCGPCTEIFYNQGKGEPVEVWNLVFTQFDRKGKGKLDPLPNKNIDTGMGLERIAAVMQGVKTNFETDLFQPIIEELKKQNTRLKTRDLNTIADHIRAVTFAIYDDVTPSNEERGYVIRKLIRRAYLRGGAGEPFLYNLVPKVVEVMKDSYPGLTEKREEISLIVKEEEERFKNTLSTAMPNLQEGLKAAKGKKVLNGEKIFKLVDTYGLPLEVIEGEARKKKIKLDIVKFNKLMEKAKELSRKKSKLANTIFGTGVLDGYAPEKVKRIANNHTATHLLHSALREVLGGHVHQAGSLVREDRLRFDFTHVKKMTDREIERAETIVNDYIKKGINIKKEKKPLDEARKEGAIALFAGKYGELVTVVSVGDFSKEVCGGTHVDNTKDIGIFKIIREGSVASGVRRIEAVTSNDARKWAEESRRKKEKIEKLEAKKTEEKRAAKEKLKKAEADIDGIIKEVSFIKGVKVVIKEVEAAGPGILRSLADRIKGKEKSSFIVLGSKSEGKANLVVGLTEDLVSKGADASSIIKEMAGIIGGSGGGRKDFAQAGGKEPSKLNEVFELAKRLAKDVIGGV